MPLDDYWAEIDRLHRPPLTQTQWEVVRRMVWGLSIKEIARELGRDASSIRQVRDRAFKKIFDRSCWIEPSEASLGAWYARHHECCDSAA